MKNKTIKLDDGTFKSYIEIIRKSGRLDIPLLEPGNVIKLNVNQALKLVDIYFDEKLFKNTNNGSGSFSSIVGGFIWYTVVSLNNVNTVSKVTNKIFDKLKEYEKSIDRLDDIFVFRDARPNGSSIPVSRKKYKKITEIYMDISCKRFLDFKFALFHNDILKFAVSTDYNFIPDYNGVDRFLEIVRHISNYDPRLSMEKYTELKSNLFSVLGGDNDGEKTI